MGFNHFWGWDMRAYKYGHKIERSCVYKKKKAKNRVQIGRNNPKWGSITFGAGICKRIKHEVNANIRLKHPAGYIEQIAENRIKIGPLLS